MKTTPSGNSTCCAPMSAADFRARATGVGNTCEVSLRTGMLRSERVASQAIAKGTASKATLAAAGYPTEHLPTGDFQDSGY